MVTEYSPGLFLHFFMAFVITLGPAIAFFVIAAINSFSLKSVVSINAGIFVIVFTASFFIFGKNQVVIANETVSVQAARFYQDEFDFAGIDHIETMSYADFKNSPYCPTLRLNGVSFGQFHAGIYKLENGLSALTLITSRKSPVTIIRRGDDVMVVGDRLTLNNS